VFILLFERASALESYEALMATLAAPTNAQRSTGVHGVTEIETATVFIKKALIAAVRRAAIGWLLNSGLAGATTLLRRGRKQGALQDVFRAVILNKHSVYLGLFMAVFGLMFQISRRALRRTPVPAAYQHALAGSAAGISILVLQPCKGTYLDPGALALHSLVRALQAAIRQRGIGDVIAPHASASLVFVACCTLIMYSWFFHPEALGKDCESMV
jgi:hypothetical protein